MLDKSKTQLVERAMALAGGKGTLADLGGIWGVHGGYCFHALDAAGATHAVLLDGRLSREFLDRAKGYEGRLFAGCGDFADAAFLDAKIPQGADVALLFDVLLHQAVPSWQDLLHLVCQRARIVAVHNPQLGGGRVKSVRLIDLGKDAYFELLPNKVGEAGYGDDLFEDPGRRNDTDVWQWGITDADLVRVMAGEGFGLRFAEQSGAWGQWERRGFLFSRTA